MRCDLIYKTDFASISATGLRWLLALMLIRRKNPVSLLDNAPLHHMLEKFLPFERIQRNIAAGALYAVSVTASGYTSGQSVSFFQGVSGLEGWERQQRIGAGAPLESVYLLCWSVRAVVLH